jgi:solute carrier family 25 phosphate transporter 3
MEHLYECFIPDVFSDSCEFGSRKYFALCGLGGILSCGITHTAIVPLDLVKCRIQVNPTKYRSIVNGFKVGYHLYFPFVI